MKKFFQKIIDFIFLIRTIKSKEGVLHFKRWRIVSSPLFNIFIHYIARSDEDEHMHDHPWNFTTIILKGGYTVATQDNPAKEMKFLSYERNKAEEVHKIIALSKPTYTLAFTGPRRRDWGYSTKTGWIDNWTYRQLKNQGKLKK